MRRVGLAAALLVAVALGIATAAGAFAPPSLRAELRLTRLVPCPGGSQQPVGPRVVRRFHAVAALSCVDAVRTYRHSGQWEVLVRRVAVGSVSRLQRYFERPSTHHQLPKGEICAAVAIAVVVPVFVDARGHRLLPLTPRGACGEPLAGGPPNVRWHVVSVRKIKLVVTAQALAAGCPMRMGNTVPGRGPRTTPAPGLLSSIARRGGFAFASSARLPTTSRPGASSAVSVSMQGGPAGCSGRSRARGREAAARSSATSPPSAEGRGSGR